MCRPLFFTGLILTSVLVAPLAPRALAQGMGSTQVSAYRLYGWLDDAQFGDALAGELSGGLHPDGVVLDRGQPVLMIAPAAYQTSLASPLVGNSMAHLPGAAPNGKDAIALVGPGGLSQAWWNDSVPGWEDASVEASDWIDGRIVRTGDVDGANGTDYVGLQDAAVDDTRVLILYGDGAGGTVTDPGFQTSAPAFGLVVLDWDGDGDDDIAAATDWGVEIYDRLGNPLWWSDWGLGPLELAVLDVPGQTADRLVIVASTDAGANQWLTVADPSGLETASLIGQIGVSRITLVDRDNDDDQDIVFSVTSTPSIFTVENQSELAGPKTFDPQATMVELAVGDPELDMSDNQAGIATADFDHDGDLDLLVPIQGDTDGAPFGPDEIPSEVRLLRSDALDHTRLTVDVESALYDFDEQQLDGDVSITFVAPAVELVPLPGETLALEISVWTTPDIDEPTSTSAFHTASMPVPASGAPAASRTLTFSTGQPTFMFPTLHSIVTRQVVRDATGQVVQVGPALTGIWATLENLDLVLTLPTIESVVTVENANAKQQQGGASATGGGLALPPPVPPFGPDDVPDDFGDPPPQ